MSENFGRRTFLRVGLAGSAVLLTASRLASAAQLGRLVAPLPAFDGGSVAVLLPQQQRDLGARQAQLRASQQTYQYEYNYIPSLPMLRTVPSVDAFAPQLLGLITGRLINLRANAAFQPGPVQGRPGSLADYAKLFATITLPSIAADFMDDAVFAAARVAGANPLMLERFVGGDPRFPVTEEIYQRALPGDSLTAAVVEGRVYLADFKILGQVQTSSFPVGQKYIYAPLALFAVDRSSGDLRPVAIQCQQVPGPTNPIFTPQDGWGWAIAKTVVQIADGNVHEAVSHLGRAHLYTEPFAIATHRQLAANHPLSVLLLPHFAGTFAINDLARTDLVNKGGPVDELLSGAIESSLELAGTAVRTWVFNQVQPPDFFRARGVDDTSALPYYPYRDDALLYWEALRRWTAAYLSIYYRGDADVRNDPEVNAWARELVAQDGGRVVGFGQPGGLTRQYLSDAAALIVFTASVQHAAVNFPQLDLMAFTPNVPLAGYSPAPTTAQGKTAQDLLNILPPLEMANLQLTILYILGSIHYTKLGEYPEGHFTDPRVAPRLAAFQAELDQIGTTIRTRNLHRRPYEFLARDGIPQSINI